MADKCGQCGDARVHALCGDDVCCTICGATGPRWVNPPAKKKAKTDAGK